MRSTALTLLLLPLAACASPSVTTDEPGSIVRKAASQMREPYTTYLEVLVGGEVQAYVLRYDAIPLHADVERSLITGSYRIQSPSFEDVGFITPRGEFFRHTSPNGSVSLGSHGLQPGLAIFLAVDSVDIQSLATKS